MAGLREFLNGPAGKGVGIVVLLIGLVAGFFAIKGNFGKSEAADLSQGRVFIDAENGKAFNHTVTIGETMPVKSPFSGKNTGWEAERCYWTKEGKPKQDPTFVLLNSHKPGGKEPTFCPDCGRLVVPLNPPASTSLPPPPTQAEWGQGKRPQQQQQD